MIPLTEQVHLIPSKTRGCFPFAHSFLVRGETTALIDTGAGPEIMAAVNRAYRPDLIINTHGHPDHIAGNALFPQSRLAAPFEGRETHGRQDLMAPRLMEPGPLEAIWKNFVTATLGFEDREPDELFYDGKVFDLGRTRLTALHTPGHCLDHYCFFEERTGLLLLADLDLSPFGPWYGHRESDIGQTLQSLDNLARLRPALAVSSHEEPIEEGFGERLRAYGEIIDLRDQRILALLGRGADLPALVQASPIYGGHPFIPDLIRYWEKQMIQKHLVRLEERGLIKAEGETWLTCCAVE